MGIEKVKTYMQLIIERITMLYYLVRCFQEAFDCELEYKMLDEKEFKSVAIPSTTSGKEFEAGPKSLGVSQRVEYGLRHMSTLSASAAHLDNTSTKITPMW